MNETESLSDYVSALPKSTKAFIGLFLLPLACLFLIMSMREMITRNSKTFQDVAGLTIVYCFSVLGPGLALLLPRLKPLHWVPVFLAGGIQALFIAIGKPMSEWWLIATVAPFTIGVPLASLMLYKLWFAPRFGLAQP